MTRKEKNIKRMTMDFNEGEIKTLLALRSVKEFATGKSVSLIELLRDAITEKYVREKHAYRYVEFAVANPDKDERDFVKEGVRRDHAEIDKEEEVE